MSWRTSAYWLEPLSVVEKALRQANLIQRRIHSWNPTDRARPRRRSHRSARHPPPALARHGGGDDGAAGQRRIWSRRSWRPRALATPRMQETSIREVAAELPPIDLIFEATGSAAPGFAAMEILGNNGVLILLSGTGRPAEVTGPRGGHQRQSAARQQGRGRQRQLGAGRLRAGRRGSGSLRGALAGLERVVSLPAISMVLTTTQRILDKPEGDIKTVIDVDEGFRVTGSRVIRS